MNDVSTIEPVVKRATAAALMDAKRSATSLIAWYAQALMIVKRAFRANRRRGPAGRPGRG